MATGGAATWSKTAASNATADPAVNWAEGMAPSAVNDSARAEMASFAKWRDDISGTLTTGGTSTAYTLTTNATFASLAAMNAQIITIVPHATNGAAPTLAVDGLTAKQIRTATGVNVNVGALVAGTPYQLIYYSSAGEFILIGTSGSGAFVALSASSTLNVTGATTLSSTLAVTGDVAVNTNKFNITASSGNTAIAGTLDVTGTTTGVAITASGALSGATAAGAMVATQAEMETATATNKVVTAGRAQYHPGVAKAWAVLSQSGGTHTIVASYGVASISKGGTGLTTLTWSTAFSSANYVVIGNTVDGGAASNLITIFSIGTTTASVQCRSNGTAVDVTALYVVAFGDT